MRKLAIALAIAGSAVAGCDETPRNEYASACLNVLDDERGAWVFGASAKPVAEAFCACFGDEVGKNKRLAAADTAKLLAFLKRVEETENQIAVLASVSTFTREMGDKAGELKSIVGRCHMRFAK